MEKLLQSDSGRARYYKKTEKNDRNRKFQTLVQSHCGRARYGKKIG